MAEVPLPTPTDNAVPSTDIRDAVYAGAMLIRLLPAPNRNTPIRLGGEHYTVDGIKAEGDKVVEETRQNLIPLSRQYMTLADAQADIANIPVGAATYVRSADGSSLADEYINNAGALTATGRRMPAQQEVEQAQSAAESAAASAASGLNVLFDPLCEVLLSNPTIGGKTHVPLGTLTASLSTNSKLGFPAIVAGPLAGSVAARTVCCQIARLLLGM
ncbi:flagellar biosynthesis, cell-distal portion of basal-body rod [Klebsiella pneumoniae]|nr:flagellar biosynthesis, cell-distal portion of basal-body rod [Klebsiella pneumoniae]